MDRDIGRLYVLSNRDQSLAKIGLARDGTPTARATDYERAHGIAGCVLVRRHLQRRRGRSSCASRTGRTRTADRNIEATAGTKLVITHRIRGFLADLRSLSWQPAGSNAVAGEKTLVSDASPPGEGQLWVTDHTGEHYLAVLRRLHQHLKPTSYLEIGCGTGASLAIATCASVAIDPDPQIEDAGVSDNKPLLKLYRMTSDAFFNEFDPEVILGGAIELAFLDGMHWCEFLLRDFMNTERHSRRDSVIVLHDCLPVEWLMAERIYTRTAIRRHRVYDWTGDVWRTALLLKRRRPDLEITAYAAPPSGLVCITNLSPGSQTLVEEYTACVREMMAQSLRELGINALFSTLGVEPTSVLQEHDGLPTRFRPHGNRLAAPAQQHSDAVLPN
jgi:hypothetical protein